jgi:hypothetical protein
MVKLFDEKGAKIASEKREKIQHPDKENEDSNILQFSGHYSK